MVCAAKICGRKIGRKNEYLRCESCGIGDSRASYWEITGVDMANDSAVIVQELMIYQHIVIIVVDRSGCCEVNGIVYQTGGGFEDARDRGLCVDLDFSEAASQSCRVGVLK